MKTQKGKISPGIWAVIILFGCCLLTLPVGAYIVYRQVQPAPVSALPTAESELTSPTEAEPVEAEQEGTERSGVKLPDLACFDDNSCASYCAPPGW
ncbi:MAG: hypothetical protein N2D54_01665, partial [Chloroflexota bacterium]